MNLLKCTKPILAAVTVSLTIVAFFVAAPADAASAQVSSHDAGHPSLMNHDGGHVASGHDGGHVASGHDGGH